MSLPTYVIKHATQLNLHQKCVLPSRGEKKPWWILKTIAKTKNSSPKSDIMSAWGERAKLWQKFISLHFERFHAKMTENANDRSDKNLSRICDDKFSAKQFFAAHKLRQLSVLFCGHSWWKLFYCFMRYCVRWLKFTR